MSHTTAMLLIVRTVFSKGSPCNAAESIARKAVLQSSNRGFEVMERGESIRSVVVY
jgi:Zn-dependent alcohol dehydrogenase